MRGQNDTEEQADEVSSFLSKEAIKDQPICGAKVVLLASPDGELHICNLSPHEKDQAHAEHGIAVDGRPYSLVWPEIWELDAEETRHYVEFRRRQDHLKEFARKVADVLFTDILGDILEDSREKDH